MRLHSTCTLLCLLCCLIYKTSTSQVNDQPIRFIGIEQGLSNNAVTTIYQDKNGLLWFGTYDGLNKFNGYNIEIFRNRIGDSTTLTNNNIYVLNGDAQNRIWVGSEKGACVYLPQKGRFSSLQYYPYGSSQLQPVNDHDSDLHN